MPRTKLRDRELPAYTRGEELFNMISHIVGGVTGVAALLMCVIKAALNGNGYGVVGSAIFGASMILLYVMSSVYHGMRPGTAKRVMQILDHCTIYILIAGTYTPILLSAMRPIDPVSCWALMGAIWGISALAITLTAIDLHQFGVFSMICYIGLGWACVSRLRLMIQALTVPGFVLLLIGGLCYTLGAALYGLGKKKRWMHSIFHVFVVLGSIFHVLAIFIYAL